MLKIKNIGLDVNNAFDKLISWLDMAEERISELQNNVSRNFITEKQREKRREKREKYSRTVEQL